MTHDPELRAAAYLSGLRRRAHARYEEHLVTCDACWKEVSLARRGRQLAERAGMATPLDLRERMRAATTPPSTPERPRPIRLRVLVGAIAAATVVGGTLALARQPAVNAPASAAVTAAVAEYHGGRLPGTRVPARPAPDLSALGLSLAGAGAGDLDGIPVSTFVYRDLAGARVSVYQGASAFPEAGEATGTGGTESDSWTLRADGVTVVCARDGHSMLLLGADADLVRRAAAQLHAL